MRGKRFSIERDDLIDLIHDHTGHITYVADALQISYRALKEFIEIEHPDLFDVIAKALEDGWTSRIDRREQTVDEIAKMTKEAPGAALAAAKMTLYSARGKKRGWGESSELDKGDEGTEAKIGFVEAQKNV